MSCYDYVIKDGKLIGEFEKMYQEYEDPWNLSRENAISYSRNDTINTIKRFEIKRVIEVGCGLGMSVAEYSKRCEGCYFSGVDISETAIAKARMRYPTIDFKIGEAKDIESIYNLNEFDCIVFGEIMWYILDDLDAILEMLSKNYNGFIVVNQVFYNEGIQKYGRDYFTTQDEMIHFFERKKIKMIVKNSSHTFDHETSYETHTVFMCGNKSL